MNKHPFIVLFLLILTCCNQTSDIKTSINTYYDLKGFFEKEAERLSVQNNPVKKTVIKDKRSETRKLLIKNWPAELSLFIESDINKPAWKNSYKISKYENRLTYSATDSTLRTQQIQINEGTAGNIKHISITNLTINMLYKSYEKLDYFTDSLYRIDKEQQVKLLGGNTYQITGRFADKE